MELARLLARGLQDPRRIPPYLLDQAGKVALSLSGQIHDMLSDVDRQRDAIDSLLNSEREFVLVVLDACRYDTFESEVAGEIEGSLCNVWSEGSLTPEWGPNTWTGQYDVTYISSNPIIGNFEYQPRNTDFGYSTFRAADHVERFVDAYNFVWDEELRTVHPADLTDIALGEASRDGPTRLVVHYLQPHLPFIGEDGFSHYVNDYVEDDAIDDLSPEDRTAFLRDRSEISLSEKLAHGITWEEELKFDLSITDSGGRGYEALLREGLVSEEQIRAGYRGNLRLALGEIRRLASQVDSPVVVTSDHGELLGEFGQFDHPPIVHPILREVPWFEISEELIGTEENTHTPVQRDESDVDVEGIENRLKNLGYL